MMGKYHNVLYIGMKVAWEWGVTDSDTIKELLGKSTRVRWVTMFGRHRSLWGKCAQTTHIIFITYDHVTPASILTKTQTHVLLINDPRFGVWNNTTAGG